MKKTGAFLVRSRWIVPLFFYVAVPLLLRKSGIHSAWILATALILILGYWLIRWKFYRTKVTIGRFVLDAFVMTVGLFVLYCIEIHFYLDTNTIDLIIYILAFLSYVPTLLTTYRIHKKLGNTMD